MIGRIWHGWTKPENADEYERLLKAEIFPGIAARKVPGYRGIELFRSSPTNGEVEFATIMRFDLWEAVRRFAGEDRERTYVPPKAEGAGIAGEVRRAFAPLRGQGTPRPLVTSKGSRCHRRQPLRATEAIEEDER